MATFLHLSDIHFGQEKRSGEVIVNNDVKERLIADAEKTLRTQGKNPADGIIVTGDIAYAGKDHQYQDAGQWLDRLAAAIGCAKTSVHLVPGNHDIDQDQITAGLRVMLREVGKEGEAVLDAYLSSNADRKSLYERFRAYIPFAEAYNCPLDQEGGLAGDKRIELAEGRVLRLIGLNTALTCSKEKDEKGQLVVGAKQRVLPITKGEELIILAHHPMDWLKDGEDLLAYIRSRARVVITGHEHNPAVVVEPTSRGELQLMVAAGATVPPSNETLHYTYNIIEFDLGPDEQSLQITIQPRSWVNSIKDFEADPTPLRGQDSTFILPCPNFCQIQSAGATEADKELPIEEQQLTSEPIGATAESILPTMADDFALVLLRFFRNLTPGQRVSVLVSLQVLPEDWTEELSHALERQVVDSLAIKGKLGELNSVMDLVIASDAAKEKAEHD